MAVGVHSRPQAFVMTGSVVSAVVAPPIAMADGAPKYFISSGAIVSEKGVKNEAAAQPANVPRMLTGGSNKRAGFMLFIMLLMFWLFPRLNPTHAIRAQSAIVHILFHGIPEGSPYMLPMVIPTMKKDNIIRLPFICVPFLYCD